MENIPNERKLTVEEENWKKIEQIIAWGNRAISGELSGHIGEYDDVGKTSVPENVVTGDFDIGDTVILDLNDQTLNESQIRRLKGWIEEKIGMGLDDAPVLSEYVSSDETTHFKVFDKAFGRDDDPWYFSKWQNDGEQPSYILWSKEMYEQQEELGYTRI